MASVGVINPQHSKFESISGCSEVLFRKYKYDVRDNADALEHNNIIDYNFIIIEHICLSEINGGPSCRKTKVNKNARGFIVSVHGFES